MASTAPLWKKVHELNLSDEDILRSLDGGPSEFKRYMGREPNVTGVDRLRYRTARGGDAVAKPKSVKDMAKMTAEDQTRKGDSDLPRLKKSPLRSINDMRQRLNDLESYHLSKGGDSDQDGDAGSDSDQDGY